MNIVNDSHVYGDDCDNNSYFGIGDDDDNISNDGDGNYGDHGFE